ncbi:hypothetical protein Taro_044731 [Colocasia esculenta]|uniref:ZF-HD dimerization-type domain-containing protein n=1 Tax=Colocasia esculenta TaxID=4460 RepID=A0A843X5S3_COLES|nr:hypothetical protein [Colocasia esculenta]
MDPERGREQYRECMRNHAATLGTYAVDGCGEYTPDPSIPGHLHCAACGCHRNFHRKYVEFESEGGGGGGPGGDSVGVGYSSLMASEERSDSKRRTRTKFSSEQKEKLLQFAEKIGWRLQRREGGVEDDEVSMFCREIGITRQVFKVWMHNHKNSAASSSTNTATMSNNDEYNNDSSKGDVFS